MGEANPNHQDVSRLQASAAGSGGLACGDPAVTARAHSGFLPVTRLDARGSNASMISAAFFSWRRQEEPSHR